MDKNEYLVRKNKINELIREKRYQEAAEIADTIDWKNVRNSVMLCTISDLYKICKRFDDSREVLLLAYDRNPYGRLILYSLCELSIKLDDVISAFNFYKKFVEVAPKDTGRFILKYKLITAKGAGLEERIGVLEDLQAAECKENWMYELAYLYHMIGYGDKCVEECNQIIIYFGEGKYVIKALELIQQHSLLSYEQDALYKRLTGPKEERVVVSDMDVVDMQRDLAQSMAEVLHDDKPVEEELALGQTASFEVQHDTPAPEEKNTSDLGETQVFGFPAYADEEQDENPEEEQPQGVEGETKVFDTKAVENELHKEAVVRTVVPQRGFDDMHEVMPKSKENSAIVFRNYDDMVSMEGDGQISFNVPEQEMIDKQITGQISITDILEEWERMKNASEKKWREDMRRKVIRQTNGIFKEFDDNARKGLLEKLEDEVISAGTVELTSEEEANLISEDLIPIKIEEQDTEVLFSDVTVSETESEEEGIQIAVPSETVTVSDPVEEQESEPVQNPDIREIIIDGAEEGSLSGDASSEEKPVSEETFFEETVNPEELFEEVSDETVRIEEEPSAEEILTGEEEASKEEAVTEEETSEETSSEENTSEEESESEEEPSAEELSFDRTPYMELSDNEGAAEELPEETDSVADAMDYLMRLAEASEERDLREDVLTEAETETESESVPLQKPEYRITQDDLTAEQKARFEAFIQSDFGREQVLSALNRISMEANHGNAIIGSEDIDSSVDLGIAFIRELSSKEDEALKVGKTKASCLNAKTPEALEETLVNQYGNALIIQDAHELRPETMAVIKNVIAAPGKRLFIAFTTTLRGKHRLLLNNGGAVDGFDVSVEIEAMSEKDLVTYARAYAFSREYTIDEMGLLALQTRISERQTSEHSATVTDVRQIVDEAIAKATKRTPKHFFDTLVGNRYDDNDMIVLKEKDFSKNREKGNKSDSNN